MRRTLVAIALAAFVLALASAPAGAAPRPKTVKLLDTPSFDPSSLTIRQGTLVRFNWVGDMFHNVSKSSGPGRFFQSGSPETGEGVLYKRRFRKAGRYRLICIPHVAAGMRMTLRVKRKRGRG
jgi:plastocyanin